MLRQLTDEFSIQDIPQQQIRLSRFRAIKASLFRCMKDGAGQAVDCYARQLLVAIAAFFRSLLKSSHSAAEQLNSKCCFVIQLAWCNLFLYVCHQRLTKTNIETNRPKWECHSIAFIWKIYTPLFNPSLQRKYQNLFYKLRAPALQKHSGLSTAA